jgi:hypothetical protein
VASPLALPGEENGEGGSLDYDVQMMTSLMNGRSIMPHLDHGQHSIISIMVPDEGRPVTYHGAVDFRAIHRGVVVHPLEHK